MGPRIISLLPEGLLRGHEAYVGKVVKFTRVEAKVTCKDCAMSQQLHKVTDILLARGKVSYEALPEREIFNLSFLTF